MRDKFRVNSLIVVPAAIIVMGIYVFHGLSITAPTQVQTIEWIKVIPYIIVLGTAVAGMNVMLVLIIGILTSGIIGITTGSIDVFDWFELTGAGWGHGVGLCQIGAAVMGEKGYSYDQILLHYYQGAEIRKLY